MARSSRHRLNYTVRPLPSRNALAVTCRLAVSAGQPVTLAVATWIPGSYLIREFGRYLGELALVAPPELRATLARVDKSRWVLAAEESGVVELSYTVFAHELTVRTPHVDDTHAFFNGANVFLHPLEHDAAFTVALELPDAWEAYAPLPIDDSGCFVTDSWDRLADTAFECGTHRVERFSVDGVEHRMIFWGDDGVGIDYSRLIEDTRDLVAFHARLFGALPYERYDFVFHVTESNRGGLEHCDGTTLATPWAYFEDPAQYAELLTLIAHEHFHAWNGKRIRPRELGPFDYQRENYTRGLWVVEGFTSFYDEFNTFRAGKIDESTYFERLAKSLDRLDGVPGRRVQSVADASFDAWIRLYRPDEDTINRTVSYYLKGAVVAMLLDLTIRQRSAGTSSLDDVMRHLFAQFLDDGGGYDEAEMGSIIKQATGVDVSEELARWVYGTDELPIDEVLARAGLERRPREGSRRAVLGVKLAGGADALTVKSVLSDGPNADTELQPGDTIVAINGRRATPTNLSALLAASETPEEASVHVFRLARLREVSARWEWARPETIIARVEG